MTFLRARRLPAPAADGRQLPMARRRAPLLELGGLLVVVLTALLALRHVLSTDRSWLLLNDGDSVLPVLVHASLASGQVQDWALSSVLFVPEIAVYLGLAQVTSGPAQTLEATAVVTLVGLYLVLRAVASAVCRSRRRAVAAALVAYLVAVVLVCLDHSSDRNDLELASLLLTATYYSASVLALLLGTALAARLVDGRRGSGWWLAALVAVSTFSNPLIVAWLVVPLVVVLLGAAWWGPVPRRTARTGVLVGLGATVVGYAARWPVRSHIVKDGLGYAHPTQIAQSASYYASEIHDTVQDPRGAAALVVIALALVGCVRVAWQVRRDGSAAEVVVAGMSWVSPVLVVLGALLLGTNATRYLAPLVFAPLAGLVVLVARAGPVRRAGQVPRSARTGPGVEQPGSPGPRPGRAVVAVLVAVAVAGAVVVLVPGRTSAAVEDHRASAACVVAWVDAHPGRIGAGTYWDGRPVKAYLAHPEQIVQISSDLRRYSWLVNRTDETVSTVSFVVQGPFEQLDPPKELTPTRVACGEYTVLDYGTAVVRLGSEQLAPSPS